MPVTPRTVRCAPRSRCVEHGAVGSVTCWASWLSGPSRAEVLWMRISLATTVEAAPVASRYSNARKILLDMAHALKLAGCEIGLLGGVKRR